jgi:hypothetical protein
VLSRGPEVVGRIIKRCWIIERDNAATVRQYALNADTGGYQLSPGGTPTLDRLLASVPAIS